MGSTWQRDLLKVDVNEEEFQRQESSEQAEHVKADHDKAKHAAEADSLRKKTNYLKEEI